MKNEISQMYSNLDGFGGRKIMNPSFAAEDLQQ